jgi:hypothetical protein
VRTGIAGVLGRDKLRGAESDVVKYRPHVSIAYSSARQPASPVRAALEAVAVEPVEVRVGAVHLVEFHRDQRMYEWTSAVALPIGPVGHDIPQPR